MNVGELLASVKVLVGHCMFCLSLPLLSQQLQSIRACGISFTFLEPFKSHPKHFLVKINIAFVDKMIFQSTFPFSIAI